jgi:hypothetical protein
MQKNIWQWKLGIFSLFGIVISLLFRTIFITNLPSAIAQDTRPIPTIVGRWIIKSLSGDKQATIIFTPEGKLFEIRQNQAFEVGGYQIIESSDDKFSVKINPYDVTLVFMTESKLIGLDKRNIIIDTAQYEKISNEGTIPLGIEIIRLSMLKDKTMRNEGQFYIGSLNRVQQAFYLERRRFASSFLELMSGFPSETENYSYKINLVDGFRVQTTATPKKEGLPTYIGGVFVVKTQSFPEGDTLAVLCVSQKPTKLLIAPIVTMRGQSPKCPQGYDNLP